MKKAKKIVSVLLALVLVSALVLVGCSNADNGNAEASSSAVADDAGNDTTAEDAGAGDTTADDGGSGAAAAGNSGIKLGVFVKTLHNPYFREMAYGILQNAESMGVEVILNSGQTNGDIAEQIQICEDMLQSGIDALIMTPQNSTGLGTLVETADQMGVPVIVINTIMEDAEVTCSIVQDDAQFGVDLAHYTAEAIGGQGRIIMLEGVAGASASEVPARAAEQVLQEEYPGIELVTANADFSQDKAQQVMADLLQAYDDVDAVISVAMIMGLGAKVSLEEAGYTVSNDASQGVIMSTITVDKDTMEFIQNGEIYGAHYGWPQIQGLMSVQMALRAIQGHALPNYIESPVTFFTAENVDTISGDVLTVYEYEF